GLNNADDGLSAVDAAGLELYDLARTKPATIAECKHNPDLQAARHGEQPLGFVAAQDKRQVLRLLDVIDLGGKIVPPQRHAQKELHPAHDAVAIADARPALSQIQLEAADIVRGGRVWRAL